MSITPGVSDHTQGLIVITGEQLPLIIFVENKAVWTYIPISRASSTGRCNTIVSAR